MSSVQVTEEQIRLVVNSFYREIRRDPLLSRPFSVVKDWDEHLGRMTEFWGSLILNTGRYKGNPVAMHVIHSEHFQPGMFEHWLALWSKVTEQVLDVDAALLMQEKAGRVAARLSGAVFGPGTLDFRGSHKAQGPYRSSPVFDEISFPESLLLTRRFPERTWAALSVISGDIDFCAENADPEPIGPSKQIVIPPGLSHCFRLRGNVRCQLHLYDHDPSSN